MTMRCVVDSVAVVVMALAFAAFSTGCTLIYATTANEENLPCGTDPEVPRCLDGYACVTAEDKIDRCVRAGFKAVGEACVASEECADGGFCADGYAGLCPVGSTDLNCARLANADTGLKCRAPCDTANGFSCSAGNRCFFAGSEGEIAFCQVGICASDSDCSGGGVDGICVGEFVSGGRSGLCAPACDPLGCFDNTDCPCADEETCGTPPDEAGASAHNICNPIGDRVGGQVCDPLNPCGFNETCVQRNVGDFVCVDWCRVGSGAPECVGGARCDGVDLANPLLGVCPVLAN